MWTYRSVQIYLRLSLATPRMRSHLVSLKIGRVHLLTSLDAAGSPYIAVAENSINNFLASLCSPNARIHLFIYSPYLQLRRKVICTNLYYSHLIKFYNERMFSSGTLYLPTNINFLSLNHSSTQPVNRIYGTSIYFIFKSHTSSKRRYLTIV